MNFKFLTTSFLFLLVIFAGCSSSDNTDPLIPEEDGEDKNTLLSGMTIFSIAPSAEYPSTGGTVEEWEYDDKMRITKKVVYMNGQTTPDHTLMYDIEYKENEILIVRRGQSTNTSHTLTTTAELEGGKVVSLTQVDRTVWPKTATSEEHISESETYEKYYYTADGCLDKVVVLEDEKEKAKIDLIRRDGNIIQVDNTLFNGRVNVYNYTYDDKEYVSMSDYTYETPLFLTLGDNLSILGNYIGKNSKNNVIKMEYKVEEYDRFYWDYITYNIKKDTYNKLTEIVHSGQLTSITNAGKDVENHKKILTTFKYIEPKL